MSILDINDLKNENKFYIGFTIFCILFALIYELFSHNVYSNYMIFAFIIPLFGFMVNMLCIKKKIKISMLSRNFFDCSIISLTIFSIIKGVLDIYGTNNNLIVVYLLVGLIFLISSFICLFLTKGKVYN